MKAAICTIRRNLSQGVLYLSQPITGLVGLESKLRAISPIKKVEARQGDHVKIDIELSAPLPNWIPLWTQIKGVLEEHFQTDIDEVPVEAFTEEPAEAVCS